MADKKDFKVVENEPTIKVDKETVEKEIKEYQERGLAIQNFAKTEDFNKLSYAAKRLLSEKVQILSSMLDCLNALKSIL